MSVPKFEPICTMCEYFVYGVDPSNDRGKPVCRAFPDGIPDKILRGGYDHRKPLGDESITFKRADGVTPEDVEEWENVALEIEKQDLLAVVEDFQANT